MWEFLMASGIGYLALVGVVATFQRNLIYFPERDRPLPETYGVADFRTANATTADGVALTGWYRAPADGRAVVLYFHGNGGHLGHRAARARFLATAGCGALMAEYRGYGGNPGQPSEAGLYRDARAWLGHLATVGIAPDRIILYGESLGAAVAVQLAVEVRVRALILEAPFSTLADAGQHHYPWLPVGLLLKDRFDTVAKIGTITAPLLILHGERDRVVPVAHGRRLLAAAPEPKRAVFLAAADHENLYQHGGAEAVAAFLAEVGC